MTRPLGDRLYSRMLDFEWVTGVQFSVVISALAIVVVWG
jgi:hypothetical protein